MSVKQGFDSDFFNINNAPNAPPTLNDVLIKSNNQATQNLNVNSYIVSNTLKVNNVNTSGFVYSNSDHSLTNTPPNNYLNQTVINQPITGGPTFPNTLVKFNTMTPNLPPNNVGLSYSDGIFTNTNATGVLTCYVSYSIIFDGDKNGSRSAYINTSISDLNGASQSLAVNDVHQIPEFTGLTGSTIILLYPNQNFKVYCNQTSPYEQPLNINGSIQILVL
jgi:hypothetical protein